MQWILAVLEQTRAVVREGRARGIGRRRAAKLARPGLCARLMLVSPFECEDSRNEKGNRSHMGGNGHHWVAAVLLSSSARTDHTLHGSPR